MRVLRLLAVILATLTAGLLLATPAGAQPPSKLTDHITDSTGALTDSSRATVSAAIDRLYRDKHIQLWVVYVDNFSRFKPDNWADRTRGLTEMGHHDALLAVATNTKMSAFSVPPTVQGLTTEELNSLRSNQIEPKVNAKDWSGAAVAAADGLNKSATTSHRIWPLIAIGVGVVVLVVVIVALLLLYRRHRRRRARRVDPSAGQVNIEGRSSQQALSIADARVHQISDYLARHRQSVGTEAQTRCEEATRYLAAAHGTEASNDAIAYANRASALAAQAQTLANADVQAAHRTPRRRGTTSTP